MLPVLALRVRVAGNVILCSLEMLGELAICEIEFRDDSLPFLSGFLDSSSSSFFCFFGTPNAFSQAFKLGVADLSPGDWVFFSAFSFSSFSLRSFSRANCSVDVTISSNSISSEQASLETESHSKSSSEKYQYKMRSVKHLKEKQTRHI